MKTDLQTQWSIKQNPNKTRITTDRASKWQSTTLCLFCQRGNQRIKRLNDVYSYKPKNMFTNKCRIGLSVTFNRNLRSALSFVRCSRLRLLNLWFSFLFHSSTHIHELYPTKHNKTIDDAYFYITLLHFKGLKVDASLKGKHFSE